MVLVKVVASGSDEDEWENFETSSDEAEFLFLQVLYGAEDLSIEGLETDGRIRCNLSEFSEQYAPIAEVKTRKNLPDYRTNTNTFMLILDESRPVVNPDTNNVGWCPIPTWQLFEERAA